MIHERCAWEPGSNPHEVQNLWRSMLVEPGIVNTLAMYGREKLCKIILYQCDNYGLRRLVVVYTPDTYNYLFSK